jgi:MarR-like DNA-binding transcriptional regulator SgrR of sgrS sRNA
LSGLVFETLTRIDENGRLQPGLASYWSTPNGGARWEFLLRTKVQLHDGSELTPLVVAKSLAQAQIPGCKLLTASNGVIVDCEQPQASLPIALAQAKYAIATVDRNDNAVGTGPYRLDKRDADSFLLRANEDYWNGRPYVDTVELSTAKTFRDQMTDFSLDRADVVEVGTEQYRRAIEQRVRVNVSRPAETVLLVVNSASTPLRDQRLRQVISLAIDRSAIHSVIYQRQGEVASGLLPNWLTGFAFLFPASQNLGRARDLKNEVGQVPALTISYDPADPLERLIAERVALNVRDAGITMNAIAENGTSFDLKIAHWMVPSLDADSARNDLVRRFNIMPAMTGASIDTLYANERTALQTFTVIPLVHVPRMTAVKDRLQNFEQTPAGQLLFDELWVGPREVHP